MTDRYKMPRNLQPSSFSRNLVSTPVLSQPDLSQPKYLLRCLSCGAMYQPDPFRLHCDADHEPALLRAEHRSKQLNVKPELPGLFQFIDWLPVERSLETIGKPITYESKNLAAYLGLDQLIISFNGYNPDRNAQLTTCSFKELEAPTVLARIPSRNKANISDCFGRQHGQSFCRSLF